MSGSGGAACSIVPGFRWRSIRATGLRSQKKIGPCLRLWARGSPSFLSSVPSRRGGRRADKAHCPDYSGRVVRIAPDDEVHLRCTPRLAARQRGILAFMPLTVVGPGRLLLTGEAARVRPGDDGCVSLRSQVPLPFPANRTPPEGAPRRVDRDAANTAQLHPKHKHYFS